MLCYGARQRAWQLWANTVYRKKIIGKCGEDTPQWKLRTMTTFAWFSFSHFTLWLTLSYTEQCTPLFQYVKSNVSCNNLIILRRAEGNYQHLYWETLVPHVLCLTWGKIPPPSPLRRCGMKTFVFVFSRIFSQTFPVAFAEESKIRLSQKANFREKYFAPTLLPLLLFPSWTILINKVPPWQPFSSMNKPQINPIIHSSPVVGPHGVYVRVGPI